MKPRTTYTAVALNLCDWMECGHEHRTPEAAKRCARKLPQHFLVRVFGYRRTSPDNDREIVYRHEFN